LSSRFEDRPQQPVAEEEGQQINLAEYWAVLVKRWRLIAICIAVALAGSLVVSFLSTPLYRASVVMSIEKEKISPSDFGLGQPTYFDTYDPEFFPTQLQLMKSREIAERAVQRLNLTENASLNPPVKGEVPLPRAKPKADAPAVQSQTSKVAKVVVGAVDVAGVKGTTLAELSYVATSPKLAADVANAVAEAYIDWKLESTARVVGQASQFLGTQIEDLRGEIDDKERKLQAYGRSKDIISMDPASNSTLSKLNEINRDYASAVTDRIAKEARYQEIQTARPDSIADTLAGGIVQTQRNELSRLEREYAEKLNIFKPEWPAMQQLRGQIAKGRVALEAAVQETVSRAKEVAKNEYLTALRREESLKDVLKTQKGEAMTLNSNAIEYNNLRVELSTKRLLMDTLLKRQSESEVTSRLSGVRQGNIRIVDRALPPGARFRPSYRRNATFGLFYGLVAGFGLVFILEYLDRSLKTSLQVEQILRLPPLGVIPAIGAQGKKGYGYGYGYGYGFGSKGRRAKVASEVAKRTPEERARAGVELIPHLQPRSTTAEAYRAFRTALLLARAGGLRSMVVTSSFPSEGKTSTASNLAIVLGQLGKRVLLIDGDLHKPRIHEVLKISNRVGLVSILAESLEPSRAIQETQIPNVSVITAGPASPNPSGLLASDAMEKLLRFALLNFEYVVIDSPPVQAVADALILGSRTDGIVICVEGGRTPREHVMRVRDKLQRANVRILGVLINNLQQSTAYGYGDPYRYASSELGYADPIREASISGEIPSASKASRT
jgi:polysaccharide biosynthesis transport protein